MGTSNSDHEANQRISAPPDWKGPESANRSCTDIIFLVLLVGMFVAMTVIGAKSVSEGDIDRIRYLYIFNSKVPSGVCVQKCPEQDDINQFICIYPIPVGGGTDEDVTNGVCNYVWASKNIVNRCIFTSNAAPETADDFPYSEIFAQFYSNVISSIGYVLGFGLGAAAFLGFVIIGLMSLPGVVFLLVWVSILVVLAIWVLLGWGSFVQYEDWTNQQPREHANYQINAALGLAIACLIIAGLWFLLILFLRKRIQLAISIIKQAMRAVMGMPFVLLWPVVQIVAVMLFFIAWLYYAAYTASLGNFVDVEVSGITMKTYESSDEVVERGWFLLFCLWVVLAMVFSIWFFRRDKSTLGCGTRNLGYAIGTTIRYHMGTAAFGSLVIAILEFIRAVLTYVQKKVKDSSSTIVTVAFCCCSCLFWCLEKCIRFINKNAYIMTAIYGYNFCTSAKKAFFLILRNIARVGAVSVLGGFVLFIFRTLIIGLCATATYHALYWHVDNEDLSSPIGPTILTAIIAYAVAGAFAGIIGMGISTILICLVVDEEAFDGHNRYADEKLVSYIGESSKEK